MNDFFTNIGPNLARSFNSRWVFHGVPNQNIMNDFVVIEQEVIDLCKEINTNKSSAINNLSSKILKMAFLTLSKQFTYLLNLSLTSSRVPNAWKKATITPLYKSGDMTQCNNYRPISILPLPGKVIEKIVHKRLSEFLETNNVLNKNQGGFRKNQSTMNTTVKFLNTIYKAINNKQISIATFIDFSKAFDTVPHDILLKKIKLYAITGRNLMWINDYLSNRKQRTFFNNIPSSYLTVTCGVPQGSVLRPLLFLLYINDLVNVIDTCETFLYADDTVLVTSADCIFDAHRTLQHDLQNIANWCKGNKLTLNVKKTKCMLLGSKHKIKKNRSISLSMNNEILEYVSSYKYLGVSIDQSLNFNLHTNQVIKTVSYKLSLLQKIRKYITSQAAIQIYKAMVIPYFDYGDILYHYTSNRLLDKLQKLQNRGLRICFGPGMGMSTDDMHREASISKLFDRRVAHIYTFMYKQKMNRDLIDIRDIRTRAHDAILFATLQPYCEKYKHNVYYHGARSWNQLPVRKRNIEEYANFKNVQKKKAMQKI